MTGIKADSLARSIIKKAGYGKQFGHSLGHGVGLDIHELPNLSQKYAGKIPAGSVVTVEPGIYLPGKFGVRLEDMVVVGRTGVRNLTKSPKAIQECVIKI
jgi:Xaa-Pro aminopeptidase